MTTTINASTSSGLVVTPDNSGNIVLQYNGVAAPCFSVTNNGSAQSVANATWTKVALNTKDFDSANAFDTTNNRFQPTVAGYYQVNAFVSGPSSNTQNQVSAIYKNGAILKFLGAMQNLNATAAVNNGPSGGFLLYLNGSTDYIELWVFQQTGGTVNTAGNAYLTGFLARGA